MRRSLPLRSEQCIVRVIRCRPTLEWTLWHNRNKVLKQNRSKHNAATGNWNARTHLEPLLTADEVAVHLRCHLKTVQKMAKSGRIPAIRRGKRDFFRLSEVGQLAQFLHNDAGISTELAIGTGRFQRCPKGSHSLRHSTASPVNSARVLE